MLLIRIFEMMIYVIYQTVGQDPYPQTAQVFPLASLMNPDSPQLPPQEFLILQQSPVTPTRRTPWLMAVPQLLRTPVLQRDQLEASTATETGLLFKALSKLSHPGTSTQPVILLAPPSVLQAWSLATQGQASWVVIPLAMTYSKAESIHPPLQPMFPQPREQSTSCCSERRIEVPAIIQALSIEPVAEKAQHDPQAPWFLTPETFPWAVQSTSPTMGVTTDSSLMTSTVFLGGVRVRQRALNSASVRSAN